MTESRPSDSEHLAQADALIEFYAAQPQGIGTTSPCECAQRAIDVDDGYPTLDPDCKNGGCKELLVRRWRDLIR